MPLFSSSSRAKPPAAQTTPFPYNCIGSHQLRLLRQARGSTPNDIKLEISSFDRNTAPPYTALSYMCGDSYPLHKITVNDRPFDVRPNLHNALRYLSTTLGQSFWIDAICIDQTDMSERSEQVRGMSDTFGRASTVASWIGLVDNDILPIFTLDLTIPRRDVVQQDWRGPYSKAVYALTDRRYWRRTWVQQEILLNRNVMVCCGPHSQPLAGILNWERMQVRRFGGNINVIPTTWYSKPVSLLQLITYFCKCKCSEPKDMIFALLGLMKEEEREAFRPYVDYGLSLRDVVIITLRHIRRFSGQKRVARGLDHVLHAVGDPGDNLCSRAVFKEWYRMKALPINEQTPVRMRRLDEAEFTSLSNLTVLGYRITWLDIFRCVFSDAPGSGPTIEQRATETWIMDPPLPWARERRLLGIEDDDPV